MQPAVTDNGKPVFSKLPMPRGMPLKIATIKIWHFDGENKLGFANGTHSVT